MYVCITGNGSALGTCAHLVIISWDSSVQCIGICMHEVYMLLLCSLIIVYNIKEQSSDMYTYMHTYASTLYYY